MSPKMSPRTCSDSRNSRGKPSRKPLTSVEALDLLVRELDLERAEVVAELGLAPGADDRDDVPRL